MEGSFILATIRGILKFYLDPGSGSMFIQLIIGAVLGLGVLVRIFWKSIKNFFTGGKPSGVDVADPTTIIEDPTKAVTEVQPEIPTDSTT